MYRQDLPRFLVEVIKQLWIDEPGCQLQGADGYHAQSEKDHVDAPVKAVLAANKGDQRGQEYDRGRRYGDLEGDDHLWTSQHGVASSISTQAARRRGFGLCFQRRCSQKYCSG